MSPKQPLAQPPGVPDIRPLRPKRAPAGASGESCENGWMDSRHNPCLERPRECRGRLWNTGWRSGRAAAQAA